MISALACLEQFFGWLLTASWQASALALIVLMLQWALRRHLNPRWRYALWLLVLTRLVLPVQPESALSLFRFTPRPPAAVTVSMTQPIFETQPALIESVAPTPQYHPHANFSIYSILSLLWFVGAVVLGALTIEANRRFARQVSASPAITNSAILDIFASARAELPTRHEIRLVESTHINSPAIMGLFRSTLLLPAEVQKTFAPDELRLIFLHELAHLKRGDVLVQSLIALLQVLHWFNPLLWFAFRRMRADREPAADALALSRAGENEKERYGLMLLKLLEHFHQRQSLPTLVGILEDKDPFKRRFQLIARFSGGAYGLSFLGLLLLGILGAVGLTSAERKAKPKAEVSEAMSIPLGVYSLKGSANWSIFLAKDGRAYYYSHDGAYTTTYSVNGKELSLKFFGSADNPDPTTDVLDLNGNQLVGRIGNKFVGDITCQYEWASELPSPNGALSSAMLKASREPPAGDPADHDESYFDDALEKDRSFVADSTVHSSTLQADAQMLESIQSGDAIALRRVLEHGADPYTFDPDRFGNTPLYWAVFFDRRECLKLLLDHFAADRGPTHRSSQSALDLALRIHPDLVPILVEGMKRNRAILTAQLNSKLHSIRIDLPAFSKASLQKVTDFLLQATSKAGYLERRVAIGSLDMPPTTTFTSSAKANISLWDAIQTIALSNGLRFNVDDHGVGCITLYPPRDEAVIHPPAERSAVHDAFQVQPVAVPKEAVARPR